MSINNVFGIAGSAMNAQMVRMNLVPLIWQIRVRLLGLKRPHTKQSDQFSSNPSEQQTTLGSPTVGGVKITEITTDSTPNSSIHDPGHPDADENGMVYLSNVNEVVEMVDMLAAARSYQNNVEVMNTAKQLMMKTLDLTKV